jgi:hypothetical protein
MTNPYNSLLLVILPLVGCDDKADDSGPGDGPTTKTEQGCMQLDTGVAECPAADDVAPESLTPQTCGATVVSVDGAGTPDSGCGWIGVSDKGEWCLYPITVIPPESPCDYGRPLVIDGAAQVAVLVSRRGWTASRDAGVASDPARAETWARIGLAEHASVASFHRFALELMMLGAPASLLGLAHAAARDEVRHAELAFALASDFAGVEVGPGPLPMRGLSLASDLVAFAEATARDGCVAETLSALQMAEARDRATDPRERSVLQGIAPDEARHAALAWQALRWAIDQGGAPVREAVAAVFARGAAAVADGAGGLLPVEVARASIQRGWAEVVGPAARELLGREEQGLSGAQA